MLWTLSCLTCFPSPSTLLKGNYFVDDTAQLGTYFGPDSFWVHGIVRYLNAQPLNSAIILQPRLALLHILVFEENGFHSPMSLWEAMMLAAEGFDTLATIRKVENRTKERRLGD